MSVKIYWMKGNKNDTIIYINYKNIYSWSYTFTKGGDYMRQEATKLRAEVKENFDDVQNNVNSIKNNLNKKKSYK